MLGDHEKIKQLITRDQRYLHKAAVNITCHTNMLSYISGIPKVPKGPTRHLFDGMEERRFHITGTPSFVVDENNELQTSN